MSASWKPVEPHRLFFSPVTWLLVVLAGMGCERGPVERICVPLQVGDLAFSEIRREHDDAWGQWFELYNPTAGSLELTGLTVRIMKLDGSGQRDIVLREHGLQVGAGGYFVLGRFFVDEQPEHVDYGYGLDFESDLGRTYTSALVQVLSCDATDPDDPTKDRVIDQVVYRDLPNLGSLSFDGALEPTSVANDEENDWCVDPSIVEVEIDGAMVMLATGSPGQENRVCP